MTETVLDAARKFVAMNKYQAEAGHLAVRHGRVLGAGARDDLTGWDVEPGYFGGRIFPARGGA
jgi:hypothetical protein